MNIIEKMKAEILKARKARKKPECLYLGRKEKDELRWIPVGVGIGEYDPFLKGQTFFYFNWLFVFFVDKASYLKAGYISDRSDD